MFEMCRYLPPIQIPKFSNQTVLVFFLHPLLHSSFSLSSHLWHASATATARSGRGVVMDGDKLGVEGAGLELLLTIGMLRMW